MKGLCNFTDAKDEEIRTVFCFDGFTSSIYKCIFKCTKKLFFEVFGYDFRQEKLLSEWREELASFCNLLQIPFYKYLASQQLAESEIAFWKRGFSTTLPV